MNEGSHTHHSSGAGELKARVGWAAGVVLWAMGQRKGCPDFSLVPSCAPPSAAGGRQGLRT